MAFRASTLKLRLIGFVLLVLALTLWDSTDHVPLFKRQTKVQPCHVMGNPWYFDLTTVVVCQGKIVLGGRNISFNTREASDCVGKTK